MTLPAGSTAFLRLAALAGYLLTAGVAAAERPGPIRCSFNMRDGLPQAACEIGPALDLARVDHVTWRKEGRTGVIDARFQPFVQTGRIAGLFLIDRGDKTRARIVTSLSADTMRLIDALRGVGAGARVGLGLVGERLETVAALGASRDDLVRATGSTRADGAIGDTAREVASAIALFGAPGEERRVLVVASDGKAEDAAYGSQDVIQAARNGRIAVVALIFRDGTEPAGLSGLRRLAEETGGLTLETSPQNGRLDDASVTRFGQFIRSGGFASFALDPREPRGRYVVSAEMEGGGRLTATLAADLDPSPPKAGDKPAGGPAASTAVSRDAPGLAESSGLDRVLSFVASLLGRNVVWLEIGILVLAGVGATGWLLRRWRRRGIRAYIQLEDDTGLRIAIRSPGVRIGRHSENDIRFANPSVHRYHAVLSLDPESGRYVITDVSRNQERSNGVVVNSELVARAELGHGDLVELGEVRFRFLYPGESMP